MIQVGSRVTFEGTVTQPRMTGLVVRQVVPADPQDPDSNDYLHVKLPTGGTMAAPAFRFTLEADMLEETWAMGSAQPETE